MTEGHAHRLSIRPSYLAGWNLLESSEHDVLELGISVEMSISKTPSVMALDSPA